MTTPLESVTGSIDLAESEDISPTKRAFKHVKFFFQNVVTLIEISAAPLFCNRTGEIPTTQKETSVSLQNSGSHDNI